MPYESKELGAAGHVLRYRLRFHQRMGNKSFTTLARALKELGHPMSAARIGEAFNGYRRISTDELTALATALGVPASRLVLDASPSADAELVDRIADMEAHELRLRNAKLGFSLSDLEGELERAALLSKRERRDAGIAEPEELLSRLEAACIEIELLTAEQLRRGFRMDDDGER